MGRLCAKFFTLRRAPPESLEAAATAARSSKPRSAGHLRMRVAALGLAAIPALAFHALAQPIGPERRSPGQLATRLAHVVPAVGFCWRAPEGLRGFEALAITVRFALREDGSLLGEPRVSYAEAPAEPQARAVLARSALAAVRACTPVALSPSLGRAIAGRIFSIRFTYKGPQGRGA